MNRGIIRHSSTTKGDIMRLEVEKHEYEEINIETFGGDLELSIKLTNMKLELETQPYDLLNDLVGEMSKFYSLEEIDSIMNELKQRWWG